MLPRISGILACLAVSSGAALAQSPAPPAGAASCSGCHANSKSVDTPVPRLQGRSAAEIAAAMQAFKSGARPATIMDRIAKGFTDPQSQAIADWYAAQKN